MHRVTTSISACSAHFPSDFDSTRPHATSIASTVTLVDVTRVARDIQYQALMEIWLYVHVPLSFALLAALIGHVVSVFFYW